MLLRGNTYTDERGTLQFVNDFDFKNIKRFYTITHPNCNTIRAWQGHKIETKHFFVSKGKFLIASVEVDNWQNPSPSLSIKTQLLTANNPSILTIEAGNANGFKAIEPNSTLIIFSNLTLEESAQDMYRFDLNTWNINWEL